MIEVRVDCYAGYRGEETPRRFTLGQRCVQVQQVVDRWLAPDHRYFKLLGDDGATYILRHDEREGVWELTLYQAVGPAAEGAWRPKPSKKRPRPAEG